MSSEPKFSEPKYPVGSLVVCEKVGVNTPCKVIDYYPISPINKVPRYRISSLSNPDSYFTVTEEELRGCRLSSKFKVGVDGYFDDVEGVWVEAHKPTQDNQTYTNEQGGKQSFVSARFDCIPPVVLRLLAQCLGFGARKYGKDNWKQIEQWDHLNHAMNHINEWNRGDRSEPHLINAMARLTFALWQAVDQKQQSDTYIHPDEVK